MNNSSLATYRKISPNKNVGRKYDVTRITPHCVVGQVLIGSLGDWFALESTEASSNYGIDKNATVGVFVDEKDRSWASSSSDNDNRAITIECASDTTSPYAFKGIVYKKLIELCTDICKRYGKTKLLWLGSKDKALSYKPASNEMVLTAHRWFANKGCPGDWLYSRMGDLAAKVTANLGTKTETKKEDKKETTSTSNSNTTIKENDVVTIKPGAKYYSGETVPAWVINKKWIVKEVSGDRVVIDKSTDAKNAICSAINAKYLTVVPKLNINTTTNTFKPYTVRVSIKDLYIRKGPGTNYGKNGFIAPGVYTIVAESKGNGATKWGKLKSGAGWISLDYVSKT